MSNPSVRPWDAPVVSALDAIERLPGFEADRVGWDHFRFYGTGAGSRMQMALIHAYPLTTNGTEFVRFAVSDSARAVTDAAYRDLTTDDVARILRVPTDSATYAIKALGPALRTSLAAFNAVHDQLRKRMSSMGVEARRSM